MSRMRLLQAGSRFWLASTRAAQPGWSAVAALYVNHPGQPWCSMDNGPLPLQQQQHPPLLPFQGFAAHYAKGKVSKKHASKARPAEDGDNEASHAAAGAAEETDYDPEPVDRLMQQAVEHYAHELTGVRTGRANPGLIENLLVDAHGDKLPLKACGTVTVRNPQLLVVVLFDQSLAKAVEKAIRQSPLSLNPTTEGAEVLVKLPRITKESIERMVKLVNMEAEGAHQSIRRARQKGMDAIKKAFKAASTDHRKRAEKEVRTCSVSLPG
eukprot:GHRR01009661.1.p1 GENE.GHRR01009661.1~~GHRR01009661.1.p1  ORF type:complete len:268 (+),score=94.17 GHRR01009661.1:84-887(+)